MIPEPNPTPVSIITTDGPTSWTSLTYSDWSLNDCELAAGELVLQAASNAAIAVTANAVPHPCSARIRDILVLPRPVLIVSEPPLFLVPPWSGLSTTTTPSMSGRASPYFAG